MRVGRPGQRAGMGGLRTSRLWLLASLAGLLVLGSCVEELDITEGELSVPVRVSLEAERAPLLANTPRSLSLHRLLLRIVNSETGEEWAVGEIDLDPDDVPESFQIRQDLPEGTVLPLEGTVELVHVQEGEEGEAFESVEWAAFVDPIEVTTEEEEWVFEVPLGRGNLAEQAITALTVAGGEEPVVEGAVVSFSASVEGGPEGARIFWGTQDPELVSVDENGTVQTLLPGTARIVAAAGRHAEVREVLILQAVDSVEVLPSEERLTAPGQEAQFTARALDPRGDEVVDRALEVTWRTENPDVAESLGGGLFQAVSIGEAEVVATVEGAEGRATLIVEGEPPGGTLIRWTSEVGGSWTDASNWDLGRVPQAGDTVEIALEGSNVTVLLDGTPTSVAEIRLGADTSTAGLQLSASELVVEGLFLVRAGGEVQVDAGVSSVSALEFDNSGQVTLLGTLLVNGSSPGAMFWNRTNAMIDAGPGGIVHFSLAGGTFVNTGWLELGQSTEGLFSFTGGTVTLSEGGSVSGSGTVQVLNSVLNTDLNLSPGPWELFLSESEVNGPGGVFLPQGSSNLWVGVTINTFVANGGELTLAGLNTINGVLTNDPVATISIVGLSDQPRASLVVVDADGFYNSGTIELIDAFEGEGRRLTLEVPEGPLVNQEGGTLVALESPASTVVEVVGQFENVGLVRVEDDMTVSFPDAAFYNLGRIEIVGGATLGFEGVSFTNGLAGQTAAEIVGEGVLDVSAVQFTNSALIAPGFSPGLVTVVGAYTQSQVGSLRIEVDGDVPGTGHDLLSVTGPVSLAGTLEVVLGDIPQPTTADTFLVVVGEAVSGAFDQVLGGDGLEVVVDPDGVRLVGTEVMPSVLGVAAGFTFTCALNEEGRAYCWGDNAFGQLGDGTTGPGRMTAEPVVGDLRFAELDAAGDAVCGRTSEGEVYCWGNSWERVGDNRVPITEPTLVPGGIAFATLSIGFTHACGMGNDGAAYCWGVNDRGQLGDGTLLDRTSPVAVVGGQSFTTVNAGFWHSCAVDVEGIAYCWGYAAFGALGADVGPTETVPEPIAVATQEQFSEVQAGAVFTCGRNVDDAPFCWGHNDSGQVGDGTTTQRAFPARMAAQVPFVSLRLPTMNSIYAHGCGLDSLGQAWCWGWNDDWQLGIDTQEACVNEVACSTIPLEAVGALSLRSIVPGGRHTCAITNFDELYCWGGNASGQLGVVTEDECASGACSRQPRRVFPSEP
jgi:alpha-tubulin suppressor-like RCC1 family protein